MLKLSFFRGEGEAGPAVVPLFGPADSVFEKVAAPTLLSEVSRYIGDLRPTADSQYVLVNAMGASEWYGSNVNADAFDEPSLIHRPDNWSGNPLIDRITAKQWPYGFPTFYNAHAFAHHRNKDAGKAFGDVELAAWHPEMKRVELVVRVDKDKCERFGGVGVWDKLKAGQFPDVSMGTRVPWDRCSICADLDTYDKALRTFDPKRHRHPGLAVLEFHKKLKEKNGKGIRGISITRADYCDDMRLRANKILPDGRKVWVYNDFPSFFDISFVFIGADKTAKTMLFIFSGGRRYEMKPSAEMAENLGVKAPEDTGAKTASITDKLLNDLFVGKSAAQKSGEIVKDTLPSQFISKAIPIVTDEEPELDRKLLEQLARLPLPSVMSTAGSLGIVLKPAEFQRITLLQIGKRDLADQLDSDHQVFPETDKKDSVELGPGFFLPALAQMLAPLLEQRSGLGPVIERRVMMSSSSSKKKEHTPGVMKLGSGAPSELFEKLGAAYNGYRDALMLVLPHSQVLLRSAGDPTLQKLAELPVDRVFTPLSVQYFKAAYRQGFGDTQNGMVQTK
jgi:hypothetical protein